MEEGSNVYVLVMFEKNEDYSEQPLIIKYLRERFSDVVLEEILQGLPFIRDIQHCINLILGSMLPNKATYQMNSKEYE